MKILKWSALSFTARNYPRLHQERESIHTDFWDWNSKFHEIPRLNDDEIKLWDQREA